MLRQFPVRSKVQGQHIVYWAWEKIWTYFSTAVDFQMFSVNISISFVSGKSLINDQPDYLYFVKYFINMTSKLFSSFFQINGFSKNGKFSKNLHTISTTSLFDVSKWEEDAEKRNDRICGFWIQTNWLRTQKHGWLEIREQEETGISLQFVLPEILLANIYIKMFANINEYK